MTAVVAATGLRRMALVVVDYLGLAKMVSDEQKRERFIADLSSGLKNLAEELGIPIVGVAQLNREVEKTDGGKPKLSHLRESGALEQDANMVLFVHVENEEGYDRPPMFGKTKAAIIVAKNRSGASGEIDVEFWPEFTLFTDPEDTEPPPPDQGEFWQQ